MRIYELAKSIKLSNKEIIVKLAGLGISVKSHMSNIDDSTSKKLIEIFTNEGKVKSGTKLDAPKKKAKAAKPAPSKKAAADKKAAEPKDKPDIKQPPKKIKADKKSDDATAKKTKPTKLRQQKEEISEVEGDEVLVEDKFKKETEPAKVTKFKTQPRFQ